LLNDDSQSVELRGYSTVPIHSPGTEFGEPN